MHQRYGGNLHVVRPDRRSGQIQFVTQCGELVRSQCIEWKTQIGSDERLDGLATMGGIRTPQCTVEELTRYAGTDGDLTGGPRRQALTQQRVPTAEISDPGIRIQQKHQSTSTG